MNCCEWTGNYQNTPAPENETFDEREQRWANDLHESHIRLQWHVEQRLALQMNKYRMSERGFVQQRTQMYGTWRQKHGDDVARSWAKLAEHIIANHFNRPKWFKEQHELRQLYDGSIRLFGADSNPGIGASGDHNGGPRRGHKEDDCGDLFGHPG